MFAETFLFSIRYKMVLEFLLPLSYLTSHAEIIKLQVLEYDRTDIKEHKWIEGGPRVIINIKTYSAFLPLST